MAPSKRKYEEVYLPGSRRKTRVLVAAAGQDDTTIQQVPVGIFSAVEAQRTEGAKAVAEFGGSEGDRTYEEVKLQGSSRTTRVLTNAGDQELVGGVARTAAGEEADAHRGLAPKREYETIRHTNSKRDTRILKTVEGVEETEISKGAVANLNAPEANDHEPRGTVSNAYVSTVGQVEGDRQGPDGPLLGTEGMVPIYDSIEEAADAAKAEAEAAGVTPSAVMATSSAGYGSGDGVEMVAAEGGVKEEAKAETGSEEKVPAKRRSKKDA